VDITLKAVTLASGKGALGTWRSPVGQRRESEEPACADEPEGKPAMSGVYASQRLSFLMVGKTFRGKPGSERYSGNPTVADRRGACGNVDVRAPQFYPDPSTVSYEVRQQGNALSNALEHGTHSHATGTRTVRGRCLCQHQAERGLDGRYGEHM